MICVDCKTPFTMKKITDRCPVCFPDVERKYTWEEVCEISQRIYRDTKNHKI